MKLDDPRVSEAVRKHAETCEFCRPSTDDPDVFPCMQAWSMMADEHELEFDDDTALIFKHGFDAVVANVFPEGDALITCYGFRYEFMRWEVDPESGCMLSNDAMAKLFAAWANVSAKKIEKKISWHHTSEKESCECICRAMDGRCFDCKKRWPVACQHGYMDCLACCWLGGYPADVLESLKNDDGSVIKQMMEKMKEK